MLVELRVVVLQVYTKRLDNMWLKRYKDTGDEFRYELDPSFTAPVMINGTENIMHTSAFVLYKYWKDNNGEWRMCRSNEKVYATIETILQNFVVVDSKIDKYIKELTEYKKRIQAKTLEDSLSSFILNKTEEIDNIDPTSEVTDLDGDGDN